MAKKIFLSIFTFVLGSVFIFSGYIKLSPIEPFELNFVEQGFFSWSIAPFAARFLIAFEIFLGLMLLSQHKIKFTLKAIIALLLFFTLYLIYAIVKDGNTGNCGCFGTYLQMTPLQSIIKNIILLVVTFVLYKLQTANDNINAFMLGISIALVATLPIVFYFGAIQFFSIFINAIVFEIVFLLLILLLLFQIKTKSKRIKTISIVVILGVSIAIPFVLNPPDLFVIETYDFGKLNYPLKGEKLNDFATKKVDANWQKGKKVIAFLSLTCPHCRDMAFKLHIIKKQHPKLNILFVYGGNIQDKNNFLTKAKCADMPAIDMSIEEMVKISGPFFPTVVGLNNGIVTKKWTVVSISENELTEYLK